MCHHTTLSPGGLPPGASEDVAYANAPHAEVGAFPSGGVVTQADKPEAADTGITSARKLELIQAVVRPIVAIIEADVRPHERYFVLREALPLLLSQP